MNPPSPTLDCFPSVSSPFPVRLLALAWGAVAREDLSSTSPSSRRPSKWRRWRRSGQVKKWLSYRERDVLGRPLASEEVLYFAETARRIEAMLQVAGKRI